MNLSLDWHKPVTLIHDNDGNGIYTIRLDDIPTTAGIYVFLRQHGATCEALYIGRADNLRSRIKGHSNNLKLMKGIENSSSGKRLVTFAEFKAKQGQQQAKALRRLETAFIRHYLSVGHPLLNKHGTKIAKDSISSERTDLRKFIPRNLYFEP